METNIELINESVNHLVNYFKFMNQLNNDQPSISKRAHYLTAMISLKSKLMDIHHKFCIRNNFKTSTTTNNHNNNKNKIYGPFKIVLEKVSHQINQMFPCMSTFGICLSEKCIFENHFDKQKEPLTCSTLNYCKFNDLKLFLKNELTTTTIATDDKPNINVNFENSEICVGCLLNSPTIPFSCGHTVCLLCCQESPDRKSICPVRECRANGEIYHKIDISPTMGSRILTLDGGGVRGIVECCAQEIIKSRLYDIPIHKLFDLIVVHRLGV